MLRLNKFEEAEEECIFVYRDTCRKNEEEDEDEDEDDMFADAEAAYRSALALDASKFGGNFGLAKILQDRDDLEEAEEHFRTALLHTQGVDSDEVAKVHFYLGAALQGQRNLTGAEAQYRLALSLNNDSSAAAYQLGIMLHRKGDYDSVCSFIVRNSLAELLFKVRKDYAAAEAEYRTVLSLDPTNLNALQNLPFVLRRKGDSQAATERAREACRIHPHLKTVFFASKNKVAPPVRPVQAVQAADVKTVLAVPPKEESTRRKIQASKSVDVHSLIVGKC